MTAKELREHLRNLKDDDVIVLINPFTGDFENCRKPTLLRNIEVIEPGSFSETQQISRAALLMGQISFSRFAGDRE